MNTAVAATGLTKVFKPSKDSAGESIRAVNDISFEIATGSTTAILGPNGAGKTTTIEMLLGLQFPTAGAIEIFGGDPNDRAIRRQVGAMLQDTDAPNSLTVREIVDLVGHYYPNPLPVDEAIELADLASHRTKMVGQLSGGQRQRLSFAIAIIGDPKLLYLDEPTAALDVMARRRFWDGLAAYTERGATVLFSSHNLAEVEAQAERAIMLSHGRIVADASPGELAARGARMVIEFATRLPTSSYADVAGVIAAAPEGDGVRLAARDADEAIVDLVRSGLPFTHLTVTRASLEDAFVHIATTEEKFLS